MTAAAGRAASRGIEPLGPAWERPLEAHELAARLARQPWFLPQAPEPRAGVAGSRLYCLTDLARAALVSLDGVGTWGLASSVCALGAFDGVHEGHRALVAAAVADARERGCCAVAVTFDPDPADVLVGRRHGLELTSVADRLRLLASLGVDALFVVPFTAAFASVTYDAFLERWLAGGVGACGVHVGADFRMGVGGLGDVEALRAFATSLGVEVTGHELVQELGEKVSATRLRGLIRKGDVGTASRLLGRDHLVRGVVEHGRGEGTAFGFPTANLRCDEASCLPAEGVYAALVCVDGRAWPAAVNVGAPRSFGGAKGEAFLEPTLLGFSGDLYGRELAVCFIAWLRASRRFDDLGELERMVLGNVAWVRTFVGEGAIEPAALCGARA